MPVWHSVGRATAFETMSDEYRPPAPEDRVTRRLAGMSDAERAALAREFARRKLALSEPPVRRVAKTPDVRPSAKAPDDARAKAVARLTAVVHREPPWGRDVRPFRGPLRASREPRRATRAATARAPLSATAPMRAGGFEPPTIASWNSAAYGGMRWITVGPAASPARRFPGFPFVFRLDKTHRVDVTDDFSEHDRLFQPGIRTVLRARRRWRPPGGHRHRPDGNVLGLLQDR
jgi:hypothetical protein